MKEVTISLEVAENTLKVVALMLILDVKTQWYSTHQMLHKFYIALILASTHTMTQVEHSIINL